MFCNKDESGLRDQFDLAEMIDLNVNDVSLRKGPFVPSKKTEGTYTAFYYMDEGMMGGPPIPQGRYSTDRLKIPPGDIVFVKTSSTFEENYKTINILRSSPLVPPDTRYYLLGVAHDVTYDMEVMVTYFRNAYHSDPDYIFKASDPDSSYFSKLRNAYLAAIPKLLPIAVRACDAAQRHLQANPP